jgi:hypothetical protein
MKRLPAHVEDVTRDSSERRRQKPVASTAQPRRPRSPKCRARLTVQSVVQIRSGFEYLRLRCASCGLLYDGEVHDYHLKADAQGQIDSEPVPPSKRRAPLYRAISRSARTCRLLSDDLHLMRNANLLTLGNLHPCYASGQRKTRYGGNLGGRKAFP